jgi:hypothetical protein
MNEKTIRENIRRLLFEDNWVSYPTDDKAAGKFAIDADEMVDVPIAPASQAAAQVSVDAPPVEDDDYIPSSALDLAKALYELFKDTPQEAVEFVYRNAHKLRTNAEEKAARFRVVEPKIDDSEPLEKPVRKSTARPERV